MKIFIHILYQLLFGFSILFAAGPVVISEGGGEGLPASGEESDTGEKTGGEEEQEVAEEGAGEKEGEGSGEKPEKSSATLHLDGRTIPPEVRAHLQAISKENPKLGNLLQNAVFTSQSFLREFPGGIKEAQSLKKSIDEFGGLEEAQKIKQNYQALSDEQEALDSKARAGDPEVLQNLVEISGEGFSKLMPHALDLWASKNPAEYEHVVSKVIVSAFQTGGLVSNLTLAAKMLSMDGQPAKDAAIEALNNVISWANKINDISKKAPERPKVDPDIERQQKELEGQKEQIFRDKFNSQYGAWRDSQIQKELSSIAPGKKFSDFQMQSIGNAVVARVKNILIQDPEYTKSLEKIYNTRDLDELLKFSKSRVTRVLPGAVKDVYHRLYAETSLGGKKKAAASGQKSSEKPGEKKSASAAAPAAKGWVKLSAGPKPDEIDNGKTSFEMKFRKGAILKDGRKVYWGEKPPKE